MRKITIRNIGDKYKRLAEPNVERKGRISVGLENTVGEFFFIKTDDLIPYPKQARRLFDEDDIKNLAATIKEYGIRQPLTIKKTPDLGKYWVISGERRLRAAKLVGLNKVPCIILDETVSEEEVSLIENIQRSDLHPVELASAYRSLIKDYNHGDQNKITLKLGVAKSHISETLKYARLPENIQTKLVEKNIRSREILRKLCKYSNEADMERFLDEKKTNNASKKEKIISFSIGNDRDNITLSHRNLQTLTVDQKEKLKDKLLEILSILEEESNL